jgi:hypothetical protein
LEPNTKDMIVTAPLRELVLRLVGGIRTAQAQASAARSTTATNIAPSIFTAAYALPAALEQAVPTTAQVELPSTQAASSTAEQELPQAEAGTASVLAALEQRAAAAEQRAAAAEQCAASAEQCAASARKKLKDQRVKAQESDAAKQDAHARDLVGAQARCADLEAALRSAQCSLEHRVADVVVLKSQFNHDHDTLLDALAELAYSQGQVSSMETSLEEANQCRLSLEMQLEGVAKLLKAFSLEHSKAVANIETYTRPDVVRGLEGRGDGDDGGAKRGGGAAVGSSARQHACIDPPLTRTHSRSLTRTHTGGGLEAPSC